jgi:hypothetical protein
MKKLVLYCFISLVVNGFASAQSRDGGHPAYSTGGSGVSNIGGSYNSSGSNNSTYNSGTGSTTNYYSSTDNYNNNSNNSSGSYNNTNNNSNVGAVTNYNSPVGNYNTNSTTTNYPGTYYHRYNDRQKADQSWYRPSTFYVRFGIGYAFRVAGQTMNENSDPYSTTMNFDSDGNISSFSKLKKASFSTGLQAIAAFGWMINKNIGVEVDGFLGVTPRKYTAHFNNVLVNNSFFADITVTNKAISPIFVAPCFVLQSAGKRLGIYSRMGVVIPANGKVMRKEIYDFYPPGFDNYINQIEIGTKITTSLTMGFTGAVGIKYKLDKKLCVWTELNLLSISLDIKQELNTENMVDGVSGGLFPTVNYGYSGSNVNRNNQTGTQPTYSESFSNMALNAGIAVDF